MNREFKNIEELLMDEDFLAWYFNPGGEEGEEWEKWMAADPARKMLVDEARMFMDIFGRKEEPAADHQRSKDAFNSLMQKIADLEKPAATPAAPAPAPADPAATRKPRPAPSTYRSPFPAHSPGLFLLRNHLKIAWRNLRKDRGFATINIFGLALGLAVCLLITFFVIDEFSYDRYNEKADRIYRINEDVYVNGNGKEAVITPAPMAPALIKDFPQIEKATRIKGLFGILVKKGNTTFVENNMASADANIFDVFTLPLVTGNPATALLQPHSMVISETIARKYFNSTDVLGKTLLINNTDTTTITGVLKDMPVQSHFHFNFIGRLQEEDILRAPSINWLSNFLVTYVLLRPGISQASLDGYINTTVKKYLEPQLKDYAHSSLDEISAKGSRYRYYTTPLTRIHLYSNLDFEFEANGNIRYVYIFIAIASFILLIACINFMNLSTARSSNRAKEVGLRKVLGSNRSSLIGQFLTESVLTSLFSLVLALLLAAFLLPYFNELAHKEITMNFLTRGWLLPCTLLTTLLIGVLAGIYPAFFLSAFQPIQVLKGRLASGFKSGRLRNGLVVLQFTAAIVLLIGTLVIYRQLNFVRNKNLGYDKDQVLIVQNTYSLWVHAKAFKEEVLKLPGVEGATMTHWLPNFGDQSSSAFFRDPSLTASQSFILSNYPIDADYVPALGMKMAKGRNFSSQLATDSACVLVNETAEQALGYADAIDQFLYEKNDSNQLIRYRIIGVVKDFNAGSLHNKISPIVFRLAEERGALAIRIHTKNVPGLIAEVEKKFRAWGKMAGQPFPWSFMDEELNHLYVADQRTGQLFISFATLAMLIGCLGLFGLVTYAAEQRTKEIGIRKVLGASVGQIVSMLSVDFLKLVLLSALIAFPLAWWSMSKWLQDFAYRIRMGWGVFVLSALAAILIMLLTVSFRAVKAGKASPVKALRSE